MRYHIKQKVLSLHGVYNIYDEEENKCYYVKQDPISITNKTHLYNSQDEEVALIHRKVMSMHAVHYIEMTNGEQGEIREKKYLQLHDNFQIDGFEWHVKGDILGHEFQIVDDMDRVIAEANEKWFSVGDLFSVDIPDERNTEKVVAVLVTISLIHRDRMNTASTSSSSSTDK